MDVALDSRTRPGTRPAVISPDAYVKIEFQREDVPVDTAAPVISGVGVSPLPVFLNGDVNLAATASDAGHGEATIAGAEYSLDGGAWTGMAAADGAFDEVAEDLTATFAAAQVGSHQVCVRATDANGNTSAGSGGDCQPFRVNYETSAFAAPVDPLPTVNLAKAGQAVPVKWRLTDAKGVPIATPASFDGLRSYPVTCSGLTGDPLDTVEEYSAGGSGLQYAGNGNWQLNWKTPAAYAGTCRAMYVRFDSGGGSAAAFFRFK
jgi:hypothetical protein